MFNASLELYQNVAPEFKSTELRSKFGTPAQEALGGYGLFEYVFRGTGNLSILVIGNSHATHIIQEVRAVFHHQYKELTLFAIAMCVPIYSQLDFSRGNYILEQPCSDYNQAVLRLVQYKKPDILFINFYWGLLNPPPMSSTFSQTDQLVMDFQLGLDRLSRHTQLIYFGLPHLQFNHFVADELAKRLWQGLPLEVLNVAYEEHISRTKPNRDRINLVKCAKCVFVDWSQVFCLEGVCQAFDPASKLAYFIDKHHYSFLGCLKIRAVLQQLKNNLQTNLLTRF